MGQRVIGFAGGELGQLVPECKDVIAVRCVGGIRDWMHVVPSKNGRITNRR